MIRSPILCSIASGTPVIPRRGSSTSRAALISAHRPSSQSALLQVCSSRLASSSASSRARQSERIFSTSPSVTTFSPTSSLA